MDNNNPVNQPMQPQPNTPQAPITPTLPQTQPVVNPASNPDQPKSSKRLLIVLVIGFLLTIVLIAGAYIFVNNNKPTQTQTQTPITDTLETELNQVNVEDLEAEFATVEADLQNL